MATAGQRTHLAALMDYTASHSPQIHYAQVRPMDTTFWSEAHLHAILSAGLGVWMDCSEGVTALCKWAGLHDPNGFHYNGYGNTDSLLQHLPHYSDPGNARVGALVVWGNYPGSHHVAMVRRPDKKNPMLWSHGSEGDPRFIRLSDEDRAQGFRPRTFLSIAKL